MALNLHNSAHFAGKIPATTALRVLLAHAGVRDPISKQPFSEAMLFGIAGGVGVGVAAFHYAKGDFSTFFIAGRHHWFDDVFYLSGALERLGIKATIKESSGAKSGEKNLRDLLAVGPCIAWVDTACLPHRALPAIHIGGSYHVVTVYGIDGDNALIGDMAEKPVSVSLADLGTSRTRIVKQRNRLLSLKTPDSPKNLRKLVNEGLGACHQAMTMKSGKGPYAMSTLEAVQRWADRLHGSKDKESWEKLFPPGINLWRGLTSIHQFIEFYGTGGGLCRPIMAEFLKKAGAALGDAKLKKLGKQYADLGRGWTELADAALPDAVPLFKEAKECRRQYSELLFSRGSIDAKLAVWSKLGDLAEQAKSKFPLNATECDDLRSRLQSRVWELVEQEKAAVRAIAKSVG